MALSVADKEYIVNHITDEVDKLVEATGGTTKSIKMYITKYKKENPEPEPEEETEKPPSAIDHFVTSGENGRKGVVVMTEPAGQRADETRKNYPKPNLSHIRKARK